MTVASSMASRPKADIRNLRVLIVDDDPNLVRIVRTLLHGFGMHSLADAPDAAEAFEKLRDEKFDMVIVDYRMKPLDGLDFIRLMRTGKDSPNPEVPIIMLTAHAEPSRVKEARDAGVNEFLKKPVTAAELHQKITRIVEQPRPFIRTETYIGPCRRRRQDPSYTGPERRKDDSGQTGP